jgi:hypothetical protein
MSREKLMNIFLAAFSKFKELFETFKLKALKVEF